MQSSEGKFHYSTLKELQEEVNRLKLNLTFSENVNKLFEGIQIDGCWIPNRIVSLPMEGGDATNKGTPTAWTFRKYERIARGGAGLIWIEAVSICIDGRSNSKQLMLTEENQKEFKKLNDLIKQSARETHHHEVFTVLQLNHSGRYSKQFSEKTGFLIPNAKIMSHKLPLDEKLGLSEEYTLLTDDELEKLIELYVKAARLAKQAGYDAVDIKACHGYLLSESFSCFYRKGKFGGDFLHRRALYLTIIDAIQSDPECRGLKVTTRINMSDYLPYPYGWGMDWEESHKINLDEPFQLVKELDKRKVSLISLTIGNPYYIPHINKPYDVGEYLPDESPLQSCYRMISLARQFKQKFQHIHFVGVGYSWFRQFSVYLGAAELEKGGIDFIGFGRELIAYPNFPTDLKKDLSLNPKKVCITCSKCSELKGKIGTNGCVVRDRELYLPIYRKVKERERGMLNG